MKDWIVILLCYLGQRVEEVQEGELGPHTMCTWLLCVVLYVSAALVKILDMNVGLEKEVEHLSESSVSCLVPHTVWECRVVCVCRFQSWWAGGKRTSRACEYCCSYVVG